MVYGTASWLAAATPSSTRDMPLERHDPLRRRDPLRQLPGLVLPAINRLIDSGYRRSAAPRPDGQQLSGATARWPC